MTIKTISMDVDDFIKISPNPIQRDTEHHAKKAKRKHLSSSSITQHKVSVARWGSGITNQCKLDGHTRSLLWKRGELKAPSTVSVDIYKVADKKEAIKLYIHFDNKDATESVQDQVSGALKYIGIKNASSTLVRNCGLYTATQIIDQAMNRRDPHQPIADALRPYKNEIQLFCNQMWNNARPANQPGVPGAATTAFIITARLYKLEVLGFWEGYYTGEGTNTLKHGRDGSKAAADWVHRCRFDGNLAGRENVTRHSEAIINAYMMYRKKQSVGRITELYKRDPNHSASSQLGERLTALGFE